MKTLNDALEQMLKALPPELGQWPAGIRHNIKAVIQDTIQKMDLVTREEFDAQTKVLARLREKVEVLQARLKEK
ncbi:MAG TPA: accessory factor UbiK family protein [Coxiellaceae bacterium]|nr:accessory factor UbiK family protein [Coxiellaceae bacterium]